MGWVLDDDAGRRRRHADDVVLEAAAARQLDVDERQTDPVAVVQRSLAVDGPPHRRDGTGERSPGAGGATRLVEVAPWTSSSSPRRPSVTRSGPGSTSTGRPSGPRKEWLALVVDAGYAVPTWPAAWFGRGLDADTAAVVAAEFRRAGAPGAGQDVHNLWANTVLAFGTEALKQRFIRPLLLDDVTMCLLYSEPGAGSDLAGLQTRAERDGDEWVVTGQKVWTSGAQQADYGMLIARTDWDVPKHRGISFFWCPMKQDGVEVRPIRQITGESHFNEVFLDDARIPADHLLGGLNEGWRVLQTALAYERSVMGDVARGPRSAERRARRRRARRGDATMPSRSGATARAPRSTSARWPGTIGRGRRPGRSARRSPASTRCARSTAGTASGPRPSCEQGSSSPILSLGKLAMSGILHEGAHVQRADRRRRRPARRPGQPPRRRRQLPVAERLLHVDRRRDRPDPAQHHRRARARPAPRAGGRPRRAVPRRRQGDRRTAADQGVPPRPGGLPGCLSCRSHDGRRHARCRRPRRPPDMSTSPTATTPTTPAGDDVAARIAALRHRVDGDVLAAR